MRQRRSDYDVTDSIKTTDAAVVGAEVRRIYLDLFRKADVAALDRSFVDFAALYGGQNPDYHACDTAYHDVQHVLDVTLAMARLIPEFEAGGVARRITTGGQEEIVFASAEDLIAKTADFYETAAHRLDQLLEAAYRYAEPHFGGHNYYVAAVEQNISYARKLSAASDTPRLRRQPPQVLAAAQPQLELV